MATKWPINTEVANSRSDAAGQVCRVTEDCLGGVTITCFDQAGTPVCVVVGKPDDLIRLGWELRKSADAVGWLLP